LKRVSKLADENPDLLYRGFVIALYVLTIFAGILGGTVYIAIQNKDAAMLKDLLTTVSPFVASIVSVYVGARAVASAK
jgi:hypothetical protein